MKDHITTNPKKSILYHHKRSFQNCFSCLPKTNIDYQRFKNWKNNCDNETTLLIAETIIPYITNYYDFITTAPPSKLRDLNNYCCFKLCEEISSRTGLPFIKSFQQRRYKYVHGRFASLKAEDPLLIVGWAYEKQSILFIDDMITSGMTAKKCYEAIRNFNNHVDGIIYCRW